MAVSGNGWPVSASQSELGIETFMVGGASFPVREGKARQALEYVITQVHNRVEKANPAYGCWGYSYRMNANDPTSWSNHASGTAVDFNATLHPNGVAAYLTFSAAQIAEIHQILAEVGGVVRWGGDYSGTPDAMHFEINASPEALDVAIDTNAIPDNGEIKSIGAPTLADPGKIPVLTENSISYPTMMNFGHGYAQWKFTPTQTGIISIDAILSHYADPEIERQNPQGPTLNLYIFEIAYNSLGDIIAKYGTQITASPWGGNTQYPQSRLAGQMNVSVVAGKNYIIRTTCTPSYPWIRAVVRIGDFAKTSDWITPPEVEAIMTIKGGTYTTGYGSLYYESQLDGTGGPSGPLGQYYIYVDGHPGWLYRGLDEGPRFTGRYEIRKTIFGQSAWSRSAGTVGMECCWRWARRFDGTQSWSNGPGLSWYGPPENEIDFNFIYDANGAGSASCWYRTEMEQSEYDVYTVDDPVGVVYKAVPGLISWNGEAHRAALFDQFLHGCPIQWEAYAHAIHVDFDDIRDEAGASGWGGAWKGPSMSGGSTEGYRPMYMPGVFNLDYNTSPTAEWEFGANGRAKIVDVAWALDEYVVQIYDSDAGGNVTKYPQDDRNGAGSVINWYVEKPDPAENLDRYGSDTTVAGPHPYGHWGPWGDCYWYAQAPGDGPSSLAARCDLLTTTSGGMTTPWKSLDSSYWAHANDRIYDGTGERPAIPAQARFIAMPRVMLSDAMPFTPPSGYGGDGPDGDPVEGGLYMPDFLRGQSIALKITVQPNRYRIKYQPRMPDITYAGGPEINLNQDDRGQVLY